MEVRLLLVLSKIHDLHTQSIYFTLAFPQEKVKVSIYLHTPQGIIFGEEYDKVALNLRKNIYGLKDTERIYWEHLSEGLIELGFQQMETDQCA